MPLLLLSHTREKGRKEIDVFAKNAERYSKIPLRVKRWKEIKEGEKVGGGMTDKKIKALKVRREI